MFYDYLWSDPEPDNLTGSGSRSDQKGRIRPAPEHCLQNYLLQTLLTQLFSANPCLFAMLERELAEVQAIDEQNRQLFR